MASDGRIYDPKILIPGGSGVTTGSLWAQTTHSTDTPTIPLENHGGWAQTTHSTDTAEPPMVGAFDLIEDTTS